MVSTVRARRRGFTIGFVTVLGASALAAIFGLGVLNAGARTADDATVSPAQYLSTGALGAATGDSAVGLQTPYFDPPALSNPSTPGFTINSGADQPIRS
jgi:hydrogenase/urease accessory protein HupE